MNPFIHGNTNSVIDAQLNGRSWRNINFIKIPIGNISPDRKLAGMGKLKRGICSKGYIA